MTVGVFQDMLQLLTPKRLLANGEITETHLRAFGFVYALNQKSLGAPRLFCNTLLSDAIFIVCCIGVS